MISWPSYYSINDKISEIMKSFRGKLVLAGFMLKLAKQMKKGSKSQEKDGEAKAAGFKLSPEMMEMVASFTILRLSGMVGMANITLTGDDLLKLNAQLNKIKKK